MSDADAFEGDHAGRSLPASLKARSSSGLSNVTANFPSCPELDLVVSGIKPSAEALHDGFDVDEFLHNGLALEHRNG